MAEAPPPKEAICREYIRLGAFLSKDDTAGRAKIAALQLKAEATLSTDTLALTELAAELEAYKAEIAGQHAPQAPQGRARSTS